MPRRELTLNEERALGYIEQQLKQNHSPSVREVAWALHFRSSRSAFRLISRLIGKGILRRRANGKLEAISCHFAGENQPLICGSKSPTPRRIVSCRPVEGYFCLAVRGNFQPLAACFQSAYT